MFKAARKHLSSIAMLAVAGALVVGGVAAAQGGDGDGSWQAQGQGAGKGGKPGGPPPGGIPFKGLTYGELHVQTKAGEEKVIRLDQGKISSVSADSITVTENDGNDVTIAVDEDTKVLGKPGAETALADLEGGQQVTVTGPSGGAAETIMVMPRKGELKGMKGAPPAGKMPPPPGAQEGPSE
jgi:hypothetical protein